MASAQPPKPKEATFQDKQREIQSQVGLIKNYDVKTFMSLTYSGGDVVLSKSEKFFVCCANNVANVVEFETGLVLKSFEADELITSVAVSPDDMYLAVSSRSLNTTIWNLTTKRLVWTKKMVAPVTAMDFDPTSTLLATGNGSSTLQIFDIERQYMTHIYNYGVKGKINLVRFHPDAELLLLFFASADGVRAYKLHDSNCVAHMTQHVSMPSTLDFSRDLRYLVTGAGDSIYSVYDLNNNFAHLKTVPVFEPISSVVTLPFDVASSLSKNTTTVPDCVVVGGQYGLLKVYELLTGKVLLEQPAENPQLPYKQLHVCEQSKQLMAITGENNFLFYDLSTLQRRKQLMGFNDEISDVKYIPNSTWLAVATNSETITLYNTDNKDTRLLHGHTDIVLALDVRFDGRYLISSSKDNTIRVWDLTSDSCIAVCTGHGGNIPSLAFAPKAGEYFASCSEDKTIKTWNMTSLLEAVSKRTDDKPVVVHADKTQVAHRDTINCIVISPDDKLIATASHDKAAKIWEASSLSLRSTYMHRKRVWSITFSTVDKCIATGCGDKMVRIWSLTTNTCLKVFEGHETPILRVAFINVGTQLVSSSSDGLLKLWAIKTTECVRTFDHHTGRVWSFAVRDDGKHLATGGEDSQILLWTDCTEAVIKKQKEAIDETVKLEQRLQNLIRLRQYNEAFTLALSLDQPKRLYSVLEKIFDGAGSNAGELNKVVSQFTLTDVLKLLPHLVDWNTNSKYASVAQRMLHLIFSIFEPDFLGRQYEKSIDGLSVYSERHYRRIENLLQRSYLLDYALNNMSIIGGSFAPVIATADDSADGSSALLADLRLKKEKQEQEDKQPDKKAMLPEAPATGKGGSIGRKRPRTEQQEQQEREQQEREQQQKQQQQQQQLKQRDTGSAKQKQQSKGKKKPWIKRKKTAH